MSVPLGQGLSNYELRREGWRALTERLGVSGAIRFLMDYDPGRGDYVREREVLFAGLTLEDALRAIREQGARRTSTEGPSA
jgi:hypothetical protein